MEETIQQEAFVSQDKTCRHILDLEMLTAFS